MLKMNSFNEEIIENVMMHTFGKPEIDISYGHDIIVSNNDLPIRITKAFCI